MRKFVSIFAGQDCRVCRISPPSSCEANDELAGQDETFSFNVNEDGVFGLRNDWELKWDLKEKKWAEKWNLEGIPLRLHISISIQFRVLGVRRSVDVMYIKLFRTLIVNN